MGHFMSQWLFVKLAKYFKLTLIQAQLAFKEVIYLVHFSGDNLRRPTFNDLFLVRNITYNEWHEDTPYFKN